ncbi:MAG: glycosyltransferase [Dehalococcoidia bacterium]
MIFVTVGTDAAPFDRLLRTVDSLPREERLVVQHGSSAVQPRDATCFPFLSFEELSEYIRQARVVVTHAGVGSIMVARENGKRPLVLPRLGRYGEAVDDHQLPLARRLDREGLVTLVEEAARLAEAIRVADDAKTVSLNGGSELVLDLRDYLTRAITGDDRART